ncbi:MAG: aminoacyl-tRNA hydrolase [Caldilineaceae bacterium]|nr:aminoacyl-tRNA hydrolase [Caldilineaceae bacterium]
MKMIIGLGNPGPNYANNRHNIGFQAVDVFAARHAIALARRQLKARVGDGWVERRGDILSVLQGGLPQFEREKVLLVQPLTYMNRSGDAVAPLARYYDIAPEEIIVIHDDLDLDPGMLRLRRSGGSGGQNGIKSIIARLGPDFQRVRVGIGRPPGRMDPAAYVLQNFGQKEKEEIFVPLRERIAQALECWIFEGIDTAMNRFNG